MPVKLDKAFLTLSVSSGIQHLARFALDLVSSIGEQRGWNSEGRDHATDAPSCGKSRNWVKNYQHLLKPLMLDLFFRYI